MTMRELLAQVRKQEERIEWLEARVRELVETRDLESVRAPQLMPNNTAHYRIVYPGIGIDPAHITAGGGKC